MPKSKNLPQSALCIFLLIASVRIASAQTSFEGILEFGTYSKVTDDSSMVKWMVKDGNSRLDINGVMTGKSYSMSLLFHEGDRKMYVFEGKAKSMRTVQQDSLDEVGEFAMAKVSKTDVKKKIAGYTCYLVSMQSATGITECWLTDEMSLTAESLPPAIRYTGVIGALRANGIRGIPLDVEMRDSSGDTFFSFTIKSITPQPLDASLFAVPSGYPTGAE